MNSANVLPSVPVLTKSFTSSARAHARLSETHLLMILRADALRWLPPVPREWMFSKPQGTTHAPVTGHEPGNVITEPLTVSLDSAADPRVWF